jgi:uncharacterized Zn finger protein
MSTWQWYPPSRPRAAEGGIKSRGAESWWSRRWLGLLDSFGWSARLQRGRRYARAGQVLDFKLAPGRVTARVQGSQIEPYRIVIKLRRLTDEQWKTVIGRMSSQAAFSAKLLSGTLPPEAEDVFRSAKAPLFPVSAGDFDADCSCPDWADLCKHIAAVHMILAEQFDRDPFMVFALRGRTRDDVLSELRVAPSAAMPKEEAPEPLVPDRFWTLGPGFDEARARPEPPAVEFAVLKRLGDPAFAKGERLKRLRSMIRAGGRWALDAARR